MYFHFKPILRVSTEKVEAAAVESFGSTELISKPVCHGSPLALVVITEKQNKLYLSKEHKMVKVTYKHSKSTRTRNYSSDRGTRT